MKAIELANTISNLYEGYEYPSFTQMRLIEDELRRLAEVNAELLGALENAVQPLELYKAYGWPDRAGVISGAKNAIAKAKEQQ